MTTSPVPPLRSAGIATSRPPPRGLIAKERGAAFSRPADVVVDVTGAEPTSPGAVATVVVAPGVSSAGVDSVSFAGEDEGAVRGPVVSLRPGTVLGERRGAEAEPNGVVSAEVPAVAVGKVAPGSVVTSVSVAGATGSVVVVTGAVVVVVADVVDVVGATVVAVVVGGNVVGVTGPAVWSGL